MPPNPDWPLLMDAATVCRYLTCTRAQFNAYVQAGLMPVGRETLPGHIRWHRKELDLASDRLWNMEVEDANERAKAETLRDFASYIPPALRRKMPKP